MTRRLDFALAAMLVFAPLATAAAPEVEPARLMELINHNLDSRSQLLRVVLASEGEKITLRSGHSMAVGWPGVLILEFKGPYSSLRTGIRGNGCWFRLIEVRTGLRVGSGGGPCRR